jgi:chemotaxis protein MotB
MVREGKGMRLRVYLSFLGDKADLFEPKNAKFGAKNRQILEEVAAYLRQFEGYDIVIEGHTNRARFDVSFEREQKEEMLPLAEARAKAVLTALAELGIERKTMKAVAVGGSRPLAKFEDSVNNWKNRRVEIVITKK